MTTTAYQQAVIAYELAANAYDNALNAADGTPLSSPQYDAVTATFAIRRDAKTALNAAMEAHIESTKAPAPPPTPADAERWHAYALAALAAKNSDPITAADLLLAAFKSRFPAA